jgi:hypothetical protein
MSRLDKPTSGEGFALSRVIIASERVACQMGIGDSVEDVLKSHGETIALPRNPVL